MCFVCLLAKEHAAFKWSHDLSSGFSVLQGSAETLAWWGLKIKHLSISYFLGNFSAGVEIPKLSKSLHVRQSYGTLWPVTKLGRYMYK